MLFKKFDNVKGETQINDVCLELDKYRWGASVSTEVSENLASVLEAGERSWSGFYCLDPRFDPRFPEDQNFVPLNADECNKFTITV